MIQGLPPLMSPTIPAWPSSVPTQRVGASATVAARTPRPTPAPTPTPAPIPPRSHIGGKQPGKLPMSTLHGNSFSSEDDSSDSGSDSDASGNDSDDYPMSEVDADPRERKSIGRKTAEFSGIADKDSGAGQSPLSHARKSYGDNGVSLLTSEQVEALPSRRRGMVLSKNPVVVKITIPRTHRQALKSIGHPQADGSASSNLTKHRLSDSSDSEDRKKPKPKSKGKNLVSESTAIPWKRLPDDGDEDSDDRKKSKPKTKARRSSADSDSERDSRLVSNETSKGQAKSADIRKASQRRDSVDRPHSRPKESKSLSPVVDRNRDYDRERNGDRDKWKSYHSADEGEIEETSSKSHQSFRDREKEKDKVTKVKTEGKDRSEQVSSKDSHKNESASRKDRYTRNEPGESKSAGGHARERSDSIVPKDTKDRADLPQSRKEESKEKSTRTEKPTSSTSKDRKEDDSSRTAGNSKTDRSSTHGLTTAVPSSPSRRPSRDDAKDSGKSRGDKDSRDDRTTTNSKDARSSTSTSTGTTKDRARGRSRTRSRSRSPRGYYDRKRSPSSRDARDSKSTRDRREYDDDRSSSRRKKESRQRDHSRDRNDRSSRGRSRDRSRDRFGRDRSRDRSTDRGNSRDRKRARSRSRERRSNRDTHSPPPSARQDAHRSDSKQDSRPGLGRRESESHHGSSISSASAARRPSQAVSSSIKEEPSSASATSAASTTEAPSSTSGNVASASASVIKRVSIEDYQRKRGIVENKVETPKAAIDSPALASTTSLAGRVSLASNDTKDQPSSSSSSSQREQKSSSSQPKLSNEVSKKAADYYNTFRLLRAEGTTHKHNADKTLKTQNNPRLGAVQYFLGAIDFIAAFQANDKYLALSNPGQPDVAMKESVHSWETMRQFIFALTNQCHQNHLTGLDGLSALVEVLVYFKVYSCHATLLRKEMLRSGQFKTKVSKEDIANGATVAVSADLASRMMQNMEDWSHIQKRTEDVRQWLTPDIARAQFPETFARWLIHPDQVAAGTAGGYVQGTTNTAKIQWPLGTHLSLHTLMEMVVEAVKEFCQRHGLNGKPT